MGERATCPVCNSHSSTILYDINRGANCSFCDCDNLILSDYQMVLEQRESYFKKMVSKQLIDRIDFLEKENCVMKNKLHKLSILLDHDSGLINSLNECIEIIHKEST